MKNLLLFQIGLAAAPTRWPTAHPTGLLATAPGIDTLLVDGLPVDTQRLLVK